MNLGNTSLILCFNFFVGGRYEYKPNGLVISNITEEDNGRYICRAEVAAEGRLKEKQIDVEAHSE